MGNIEARLKDLGLALPPPRTPTIANIVKAVPSGNLLFVSGHGPWTESGLKYRGKLGADLTTSEGYDAARHSLLGCLISIKVALGDLDHVSRIVKLLGFVASAPGFNEQPLVMNGASDLLVDLFGESGIHGRSAIGVAELPLNMPVEIEMIIEFDEELAT